MLVYQRVSTPLTCSHQLPFFFSKYKTPWRFSDLYVCPKRPNGLERLVGWLLVEWGSTVQPEVLALFFRYLTSWSNETQTPVILLMEEIRLTCWYGKFPILYRVSYMLGVAGFLPSTVVWQFVDRLSTKNTSTWITRSCWNIAEPKKKSSLPSLKLK